MKGFYKIIYKTKKGICNKIAGPFNIYPEYNYLKVE